MKIKTLATFAVTGLAVAGMAYVVPAFADEAFDDGFGAQQFALADNSSSQAGIPNELNNANSMPATQELAANDAQNQNAANSNNAGNAPSPASPANQVQASNRQAPAANNAAPAAGNADQPTADVPSGDEDF